MINDKFIIYHFRKEKGQQMKSVLFRVTEDQHGIIEDFIIKNKRTKGKFKSFNSICQAAMETFIKNNINSLPAKETAVEIPAPKETVVAANPFAEMNIRF